MASLPAERHRRATNPPSSAQQHVKKVVSYRYDSSPRAWRNNADNVVKSVCPYCAVGCGQNVYVKDSRVIQIEGDPDSPVRRGRLCPKGSASLQLTTGGSRQYKVRYRRPFGQEWEDLDLDTAMDMIADRVLAARRHGWQWEVDGSVPAGRSASGAWAEPPWTTRKTT